MRKSLLGRFLLAFSAILLANLVLVVGLTLNQSRAALEAEYRYRLNAAADKAITAYLQQGRQIATGEWAQVTNSAESNLSSIYVAVWKQSEAQNSPPQMAWSDRKAASVIGDHRLGQVLRGGTAYWMDGDKAYTAVSVNEPTEGQVVLLIGLPKPAQAPLWHYGQTALYTLLAVSVPTLLLAWAFFGRITRPLSQMVQIADAVAEGDFSQRVGYTDADEVGTLGNALNQMAQQLDTLDKTRRTFLAGVSHDLRTPLTTIKANTQAMLDQVITTEEQPDFLSSTIEEIDRLRGMVDSLIEASSPEAMSLNKAEIDLCAILHDTLKQLQLCAQQVGVQLVGELGDGIIVLADQNKLRRALLNILHNAIRFSPGGSTVKVSSRAANGSALVTVQDSGCGIGSELCGKAFEPFVKGQGSNGSGLGLYTSKQIVAAHRGDISIESAEGIGTTVTISLPLSGS